MHNVSSKLNVKKIQPKMQHYFDLNKIHLHLSKFPIESYQLIN